MSTKPRLPIYSVSELNNKTWAMEGGEGKEKEKGFVGKVKTPIKNKD